MGFEIGLPGHGASHLRVKVFLSLPWDTISPYLIVLVRRIK